MTAQSVSLQDLLAEAERIDGETALELERTRMAKTAISSRIGSSYSRRSGSRAGSTAAAETANRRPPSEMLSSCPSSRPRSVSIGFSNSFRPASTTCGEMGWWERPATSGSAAVTSRSRKSKQDQGPWWTVRGSGKPRTPFVGKSTYDQLGRHEDFMTDGILKGGGLLRGDSTAEWAWTMQPGRHNLGNADVRYMLGNVRAMTPALSESVQATKKMTKSQSDAEKWFRNCPERVKTESEFIGGSGAARTSLLAQRVQERNKPWNKPGRLPQESMCVGEFSKESAGPFGIDDSDKDFRRHNFFGRFVHSTSVPTCPR